MTLRLQLVMILAAGTFIFNTSEFIPIGLLSSIAFDFQITESKAGMIITFYAWIVALFSLPLMLYFRQTELKRLMLGVFALFVFGNFLAGMAHSFYMLMAGRLCVALAHALFWSIVTPMGVRAAPKSKRALAIGIIVSGSSLAFVAGLPIGRILGLYLSWRWTFLVIAAAAFIVMCFFWRFFPHMPNSENVSLTTLPQLFENRHFRKICILTAIFITGQFTAYSYVEPFLAQHHFNENVITLLLTFNGVSGIVASFLFSKFYTAHRGFFVHLALFGVFFSLLLFNVLSFNEWFFGTLCAVWGLSIVTFNLVFQAQLLEAVPQARAIASSIFSGIYNIGIGGGAFVGGWVVADLGFDHLGFSAAAIVFVAIFVFLRKLVLLKLIARKMHHSNVFLRERKSK